jgi:hypothetical protein
MWFVEKLGPLPGAEAPPAGRTNGAAKTQAKASSAQRPPAAAPKAAPEPEKKKKKGWF